MTDLLQILYSVLVFAGSVFLVLLVSFFSAYIFGYGFTFGTVAAKRRIGIIAVHAVEEKVERPFKNAAHDIHKAEDTLKRQVKHDAHDVKDDLHRLDK